MRIANIIATGSEVTSGQILNSNASWIAQKLSDYNFEIQRHIAVDDNSDRVLEALVDSQVKSDLVVVTGGLGPTTDDLTRKIVADWSGLELEFNEHEWQRIQERLKSLDVSPRAGHKWQAYFPQGAGIFTNHAGTASGFSLEIKKNNKPCTFWFLPGPPFEIKRIWKDHLTQKLMQIGPLRKLKLLSWQFIDLAESELAHIVEPILKPLNFDVGYRASPPLVELKVWVPESITTQSIVAFKDIEHLLKEHIHYKNSKDPMIEFFKGSFKNLNCEAIYIQDEVTSGELLNRIQNLKSLEIENLNLPKVYYANLEMKKIEFPFLKVYQEQESSFKFEFWVNEIKSYKQTVEFRRKVSSLRQKKWICEMLFKKLYELVA